MTIQTEKYLDVVTRLPDKGQHIIAYQKDEHLVVYQAYNHQIADYAIKMQTLGGNHYSYNRMSWIKPNFLWMMYRCGWSFKENQERVLAIWINKNDFETILKEAVFSAYHPSYYNREEQWKKELDEKEVRLQWDPDHDPYGSKLTRRAIQLGMKGNVLRKFGTRQITLIEDITDFVKEQKACVDNKDLNNLLVPAETVYQLQDDSMRKRFGID